MVHGEVVGGPSLPKHGGGGDATTWWKTGNEDKWEVGHREETWILPCFVYGTFWRAFGPACCTLVVPWFLHGQRMRPSLCNWSSPRSAKEDLLASASIWYLSIELPLLKNSGHFVIA